MRQENHPRLLPVTGAYNMRDLGGYQAAEGKYVKWQTIFRSGDLNHLTDNDLAYLASLPLRTDIDFRGQSEKDDAPDRMPPTVTQYIPLAIEGGDMSNMKHFDRSKLPTMLQEVYAYLIRSAQDTYKEFFRIVSDDSSTPLLFHCSAGKDRTGVAAALFLAALGVDRETILDDYLLSAEYIKGKYDFIIQAHPEFEPLTTVKREYLEAAFLVIDSEFGGMENYLTRHLDVDTAKLCNLYTE